MRVQFELLKQYENALLLLKIQSVALRPCGVGKRRWALEVVTR